MLRDRKYLCWVKLIQLQKKKTKQQQKKTQKRAKFPNIEWMSRGRSGNMREEEFNARSQLTHSSCSSVSCQVWCWKKLTSVNIQQHLELKLQKFNFAPNQGGFTAPDPQKREIIVKTTKNCSKPCQGGFVAPDPRAAAAFSSCCSSSRSSPVLQSDSAVSRYTYNWQHSGKFLDALASLRPMIKSD